MRWLKNDKVTYAVARSRLKQKFGISLAISSLCRFLQRQEEPALPVSDVALDIIIQSTAPVRLTVKRRDQSISLTKLDGRKAGNFQT